MKVFLISPVRKPNDSSQKKIRQYIKVLEKQRIKVHWPIRDTPQEDPSGGYIICQTNFQAILNADEIHIWYDETSQGSKFDMGGVFMLVEILGEKKKIVIVNDSEIMDDSQKSFYKVFKLLQEKTK